MSENIKVTYYLDVTSSWCYWAEPAWAELRQRYAKMPVDFGWAIALHSAESAAEHEEGLGWVRWLFQSVRAQSEALLFSSDAQSRVGVITDWQGFIEKTFLPAAAPALAPTPVWRSGATPMLGRGTRTTRCWPDRRSASSA